ncbi:MAG: site-specific integrase [Alphaproteobacteria bacterium]|nr:site-specific integrase [Alphaproteobacteria bacterium]
MTQTRKYGPIGVRPQKVKSKATGKWFMDIPSSLTSTGKRMRKLYPNKTEAEATARELKKRLRMHELGYEVKKPLSGLTFSQGVKEWEESQKRRVRTGKLRDASLTTRMNELKPVQAFLGDYSVTAITTELMEKYQERRDREGCRSATVNSEVASLKQVLHWLVPLGHLQSVPNVEPVPPSDIEHEIPTEDEVVALIGFLPEPLKLLVRMMAETGMRPGEVYNLPWRHVNLKEEYLRVRPFRNWRPKNERSIRRVWLSSGLRAEMHRLPKNGTFVFSGRDTNKPITDFKKALNTAVEKAKLERYGQPMHLTPKIFRKAFATWQAERGVSPSILQKQLGHAPGSRMTEQYYIHVRDFAVKEAGVELPMNEAKDILAISGNADTEKRKVAA